MTYARAASMREAQLASRNSLMSEPVVLKVKFSARTWLQIDFVQELNPGDNDPLSLSVAVLGPVPIANITEILHCMHGRRVAESVRSFEDGTLIAGIQVLKEKLASKRADAWVLQKLGIFTQTMRVRLQGGEVPELTMDDHMRRLKQGQVRA